jgi:hypothetical protein
VVARECRKRLPVLRLGFQIGFAYLYISRDSSRLCRDDSTILVAATKATAEAGNCGSMYDFEAEYKKLQAEKLPLVNDPSIYPLEAPLPEDPFLREGIEVLRKLEPEIPTLNRTRLNGELYIWKQRILSWGYQGKPIDERFMTWALRCADK